MGAEETTVQLPPRTYQLNIKGLTTSELGDLLTQADMADEWKVLTLDKDRDYRTDTESYSVRVVSSTPEGIALAMQVAERDEEVVPFATKRDGRTFLDRLLGVGA
jgi:hypothetical protein